ncbi:MAG: T9SS type A sorting domain-containing protein [Caldithrix sp.]|nr:T9SS type A sorting domain-containing protein [Caldithrix sp.]
MIKKLLLISILCLLPFSVVLAQEVSLEPYGVSPAQIKADTVGNDNYVGILDRVYSGLLNVGVETEMVLKGMSDMALVSPTWTVLEAPTNSMATVTTQTNVDTSTQMAKFIPDLAGTYVIEFADQGASASVTVNAATYLGVGEDEGCTNGFCHQDQVTNWRMTGHADMLKRGLDGMASSHYNESCISCHTVGYDTMAVNDGFDDFPFEFPAELKEGTYDSLKNEYPEAMRRGNIQCESCHGPASAHDGATDDNKMVASLSTSACATCHDDDHYHVYPSQWNTAGHSNLPPYPAGNRTDCGGCHNGAQFIQFSKGETITKQPPVDVTCAVCHDPHKNTNEYQVRNVEATLANGQVVTDGGTGKLCMNCHQNRRDADTYTNSPRAHYGPHYAPQADMLIGTNAVTFGKKLPTSPHAPATENSCVDCHMYEKGSHGEHDEDGNLNTAGMHSFSMVSKEGVDNVSACVDCHGDVGATFEEKKFFFNGKTDHDGDGTEEGLQAEVHGLMDQLGAMLPSSDPHADVDSTWTRTELKAAFNHRLVYYDHSYGIHNPAYTVSLLKVTIQALENNAIEGEVVAIDDIPNDQGKQVKIIWDKFVDDGIAVDPVENYVVKRYDAYDDTWTGVGQHVADGSMRYALVVPTLFDSTDQSDGMTPFMVEAITGNGNVHHSEPAEGYSVDNLIPQAPVNVSALLADHDVELSWEAADDPDINYYQIYRATTEGFVPDESNMIATTTGLQFTDKSLSDDTYYYKVVAVDFSGNIGEPSMEVNANVTAIAENAAVPTEFSLEQNYPNPFNPTTTIDFSLLKGGNVALVVYNSLGQEIQTLVNEELSTGRYSVNFNGNGLSSGVYFYSIQVKSTSGSGILFQSKNKMILIK